jgi:hypothetical protein
MLCLENAKENSVEVRMNTRTEEVPDAGETPPLAAPVAGAASRVASRFLLAA